MYVCKFIYYFLVSQNICLQKTKTASHLAQDKQDMQAAPCTQKCHFAHTKAALCTGKSGSFLAQKRHFCDTHPLPC